MSTPPSSEEMVAIVAAVEAAWPRAVVAVDGADDAPVWRFSGRWWATPVSLRRQRPYVR